ncbi:hypothetical protein K4B79_35210 [Streptomyces lincolnensis]|uniref:hypothetical protein n=1 Tax=Streptomyces lincolnensis TaxID=1915 RepID=UPI001E5E2AE4|nr:hypothetical protein [Streptomyces lincolnensis]MCD7443450.1 hypothetical protein [Streptomyces lincolnensis]
MNYAHVSAELLAEEELPGYGSRSGRYDSFLVRDRACWLVSATGDEPLVGRVAAETSRLFAEQRRWPAPRPGHGHGFASPLPDGGLATVDNGLVTVYDGASGVRWRHEFDPWSDSENAGASCVADASGRRLLVTTTGDLGADGSYAGDLCVALDLADGRPVTETVLPSATAGYVFQQSLTDPAQLFLDALMGDTFHSLAVTLRDDILRVENIGVENDPFGGLALNGAVIKTDVGGGWLSRWEEGQEDIVTEAEDVLPEGMLFVGHRPGFLDKNRVLAAASEEDDATANRHLVLDAHTLRPVAELDYPGTASQDPLALGDGTWLTASGDVVRRWRVAD